jgi:hypothetical protein
LANSTAQQPTVGITVWEYDTSPFGWCYQLATIANARSFIRSIADEAVQHYSIHTMHQQLVYQQYLLCSTVSYELLLEMLTEISHTFS